MALTWTTHGKKWAAEDDGSVLGGHDLMDIQDNIDDQVATLAVTQTVTGNKTFSGNLTLSGTNTISGTNTFSGAVSFTNKSVITCLSSTAAVNMIAGAGPTTLYTVPAGKTAIITHVVVRTVSATLAGGTKYDFTGWRQDVDLSSMTAVTDYMVITSDTAIPVKYTMTAATTTFTITNDDGSDGAATTTIDVFGFLF